MAQTLFIKQPGGGQKTVTVLRCWSVNGGESIYLHANGRYAYKDGSPIRNEVEFGIMPQAQRAAALSWWKRTGKRESQEHYRSRAEAEQRGAGDFQESLEESSALDAVLYTRRQTGKRAGAVSSPRSWMEWFAQRPDWWGQAKKIEFADFSYTQVEQDEDSGEDVAEGVNPGMEASTAAPDAAPDTFELAGQRPE